MKTLLIHKMNFRRNYITESDNMNAWLHCRDSISDRLNKKGKYKVEVLSAKITNFLFSERNQYSSYRKQALYLREVLISINEKPVIYARTLMPKKYLRGFWGNIRKLQEKPLANIVFEDKSIKRSNFYFFIPSKVNALFKTINALSAKNLAIVAVRQSSFSKRKQKVLLTEVFFDNFYNVGF